MRSVVLALAAVVAGLAALGAWWLLEDSSRSSAAASPDAARVDAPSSTAPATTADAPADASRASEPAQDAQLPKDADPFRGDGAIIVKFVDAADDSPITDLPFLVYSERPTLHVYTRAITDDHGESTIRDLPEDVVIFESRRRPPLANTIFATWLSPRQRKQIVVRVGHGGTVRGRVVDDLGHPIPDAEIVIDPTPGNENVAQMPAFQSVDAETQRRFASTEEVIGRSGEDGRFEMTALLSRPAAIWIEHAAMSPKREDSFRVLFRTDLQTAWADLLVHEGEVVDFGNVVIARPVIYAGRVLQPDGTPAVGVLVSARFERWMELGRRILDARFTKGPLHQPPYLRRDTDYSLRPGEEGFVLQRGETFTSGDGSFEVESNCSMPGLTVATADRHRQWFYVPHADPGQRIDDLELQLKLNTLLVLEVQGPDGAPLPDTAPRGGRLDHLDVTAIGKSEETAPGDVRRIDSLRWATEIWLEPTQVRTLLVSTEEYERAEIVITAPPATGAHVPVMLVPRKLFPLRLTFRFADPEDWSRLGDMNLEVAAGPRPHPTGETSLASASIHAKNSRETTLRLRSEREWFITVHGPFDPASADLTLFDAGRFHPGEAVHEVTLPAVSAAWIANLERERKEREEAQRKREQPPASGTVFVRALDRDTGAAIPFESLRLQGDRPDGQDVEFWPQLSNEVGKSQIHFAANPGRYRLHLSASGYRPSDPIDVEVISKESVDLGEIRLDPFPIWHVRLRPADGDALPAKVMALVWGEGPRPFFASDVDAAGNLTIRGDLPDHFRLDVGTMLYERSVFAAGNSLPVTFELERWDRASVQELTLPHWRTVRALVDLSAIEPDLRETRVTLTLRSIDTGRSGNGRGGTGSAADHGLRFLLFAPPGKYELLLNGAFMSAPPLPLEVPLDADPPEVTLVAQPK